MDAGMLIAAVVMTSLALSGRPSGFSEARMQPMQSFGGDGSLYFARAHALDLSARSISRQYMACGHITQLAGLVQIQVHCSSRP